MTNIPKVSIIVPCWHVEKYLNRCINSLINQTLIDIEIILVDDESPDHVPEMCDNWGNIDKRVKVIHKKNEGLGMACNSGMELAEGEYIAFCDPDDWVDLNMYEILYKTAITYNADIVFSGLQKINDKGVITPLSDIRTLEVKKSKEQILSVGLDMIASTPSIKLERRIAMSAKVALYNRKIIVDNNLRFESERKIISEDLLWNLDNIAKANVIVLLPHYYYYYYDNSISLSNTIKKDRIIMHKQLYRELLTRTTVLHYPTTTKERIDRMLLGYVRHEFLLLCKSKLPNKEKKEQLNRIYKDKELNKVFSEYPQDKMPLIHRLFTQMMFSKMHVLLRFVIR